MIALGLSFVLAQDPALAAPVAQRPLDVIELRNGDELRGRILTEIDGFLEVELEPGATVGFASSQVASIHRGAVASPTPAELLPPRHEWFVLHDATGAAVGWLSASLTPRPDGGFVVNEEYEFADGARRYQVTSLAIADAAGAAQSAYFRERISEPMLALVRVPAGSGGQQDRIVDERIVEARCAGQRLVVQQLDRNGRKVRELEWPAAATFPLLARALARAQGAVAGPSTLFDPSSAELVVRSYDGSRQRSVVLDGKRMQVTEVAETTATGRNSEWVDASSRTVRRELAGPALVAVPSSVDSCKLAVGAHSIASAIVAEAGGGFGLWVPNPAWTTRDEMPAGQVALTCAAHGASVSLSRLDHLEPTTPLDAAADAVANWFRLLQPELAITGRVAGTVRERATVRLHAQGVRAGVPTRACVDIVPHQPHYLVIVCVAPQRAWDELAADFEFLRSSVELEPQALAPKLQGPLAMTATRGKPKVRQLYDGPLDRTPVAAPAPAAPATPNASVPASPSASPSTKSSKSPSSGLVIIPRDG